MRAARVAGVILALASGCGRTGLGGFTARVHDGGLERSPDTTPEVKPEVPSGPLLQATAIYAGGDRACALADGQLYCWTASCRTSRTIRKSTVPERIDGLPPGITDVAVGGVACALADGRVFCWGRNDFGQLGNGALTASESAVQVVGLDPGVTAIATGDMHACAIVAGGLRCWGWVQYSRKLGNVPVEVVGAGGGVQAVAAGRWFTCQLIDRKPYCWGGNGNESTKPLPVAGLDTDVARIVSVSSSVGACALGGRGLSCWDNAGPNLADHDRTWGKVLYSLEGEVAPATAVSVGDAHGCALIAEGVQCWNVTRESQQVTSASGLFPLEGLTSHVRGLAGGSLHTCALIDGEVKCWCNEGGAAPDLLTVEIR